VSKLSASDNTFAAGFVTPESYADRGPLTRRSSSCRGSGVGCEPRLGGAGRCDRSSPWSRR
jgi:hypothetical protein